MCNDYRRERNLPIIIYRPSIVSGESSKVHKFFLLNCLLSFKHLYLTVADYEIPGYCDSFSGPTGLLLAYMSGIKRVHTSKPCYLDMIPVDICVKGMIVASAKDQKSNEMPAEIPVYNAASVVTVCIHEFREMAKPLVENNPLEKCIGLPSLVFCNSIWSLTFLRFWFQIFPAILIDGVLFLLKKKPLLLKYQRIITNVENSLTFFSSNVFTFETDKYCELVRNVCAEDRKEFNMKPIADKFEYFRQGYMVTKRVLLHESEKNEITAKTRRPYWKALAVLMKAILFALCYKVFIYLLQKLRYISF